MGAGIRGGKGQRSDDIGGRRQIRVADAQVYQVHAAGALFIAMSTLNDLMRSEPSAYSVR